MEFVPSFIGPAAAGKKVPLTRQKQTAACPQVAKTSFATVTMGLNAKSMAKNKGKGKGKSKSPARPGGKPKDMMASAAAAAGIDTSRKEFIFHMQKVSKVLRNGKKILSDINLSFFPGAKIGVLGSNGAGKSTLLKIMAGVDKEFDGIAVPHAKAQIGYLPQEPVLVGDTVQEAIDTAVKDTKALLEKYQELSNRIADTTLDESEREKLSNEWNRVQDAIEANDGWELQRNIDRSLDALRCPPNDAKTAVLSGGERRRVALCALLLRRPDLLILDEPTNALDAESVLWLERFLETFQGTVICVTHDRYFLDNLTQWILSLEGGKGIPFQGNYSSFLEYKAKQLKEAEKAESSLRRQISAELEWIRSTPKGRQAKAKARISRYEDLVDEEKKLANNRSSTLDRVYIPPGPKLGDIVVEAENVRKTFGDRLIFDDMTFSLPRGGIVGIVGPNGSGKTTLLKMIAGEEAHDSGSFKVGETVKIMYASQTRDAVDRDKTVFEAISDNNDEMQLGLRTVKSRAYLSWFNFRGADQQKRVGDLSGGELNRLNLARVVQSGGNLLLLDEPTNDADAFFLQSLENAILEFAGCVVVVSHDRFFLDRVCTHIIGFDEDGKFTFFGGNFASYEEDKRIRLGETMPSRMKFAKIPAL